MRTEFVPEWGRPVTGVDFKPHTTEQLFVGESCQHLTFPAWGGRLVCYLTLSQTCSIRAFTCITKKRLFFWGGGPSNLCKFIIHTSQHTPSNPTHLHMQHSSPSHIFIPYTHHRHTSSYPRQITVTHLDHTRHTSSYPTHIHIRNT